MNGFRVFLIAGVTALLASCGSSSSGIPSFYKTLHATQATFYSGYDTGACSFGVQPDTNVVAVSTPLYESSAVCGAYIQVTGDKGTATLKVIDECTSSPTCDTDHLDLSTTAYSAVTTSLSGVADVTWKYVEGPVGTNKIKLYWGSGLSPYFLDVVVDEIRHPVASVEVQDSSATFVPMTRNNANHFSASTSTNTFPYPVVIRITDRFGNQVQDTVYWASDTTTTTTVQFPAF